MNKFIKDKWEWFKNWALIKKDDFEKDDEKSFLVYLGFGTVIMCAFLMLVGCAKPEKEKRDVSQYRVELGKKCLVKEDGSVAWSYVWIADQNVTLVKCK